MTSLESKFIQWKKLYQLSSGTFYNENEDIVQKKLLAVHKEIQNGLSSLKKPSEDSNAKLEKLLKEKQQETLIPFTQKLYPFLDLDVNQSFEILCYYLVNEYRGPASSLQNFVSSESLMIKLLNDIWFYYSLERMVMLKLTKCIVEFHNSTDHPYSSAFKAVIDKIGIANLRTSYIGQFEALVNDVQQVKFVAGDTFNSSQKLQSWSERKHREMSEILQIITITCHYDKIPPAELLKLVELFKSHSFGKQNQFLSPTNASHVDLVQRVTYNEIALLLVALSTTNLDSMSWMTDVVTKLDDQVVVMHHYPEHGPVLLSWMLFKFAAMSNDNTTEHFGSYGKLGSRAVQLNVFDFLHKMMKHRMFKDNSLVAKITARCIYDNLSFLCDLFNSDGSIAQHPKIFELFSEVLKFPGIAKDFCQSDDNPILTLFNSAVEKFPVDFIHLSNIGQSLASATKSSHKWILNFVQHLPVYTEQPSDPLYELKKLFDDDDEDAFMLLNDYQPFRKINEFVLSEGTKAIAREDKGKMLVHFLVTTNYFQVLHNEIDEMMSSIINYSEIADNRLLRLESGIRFLAALLHRIDSPENITNEMIHPTEMVLDILNKFKTFQTPSLDLMAACLDVCTELLPFFGDEIFRRLSSLNITPSVNSVHGDFRAYASGVGFESGLVGFYLVNIERPSGRYVFLKSYLAFLKRFRKLQRDNVRAIELPGLIFMLREIFIQAHSWHYENEQDKLDIFIHVLEFLHEVLVMSGETVTEDPARKLLLDVCIHSLLNLESSVALLKFVAVGNPALLSSFVEYETNWFTATDSNLNLLVLNAMRILMKVLRLKEPTEHLTPLEQLIYTQPKQRDTLKIIPIVTSYTTYPFNRRFAVLSCHLLRRFAIEFQSSLSACLDMEPDQIRMMFLQRLSNELESEELKIAVLDLVNACIDKQPGLTEAFFKVTYEQDQRSKFFIKRSKESESMCEGILTYMEKYLEANASDPSSTTNEQLKRILNLFHALWKQGLQALVKDLMKKDNFWPSLCSPLLTTPIPHYQYSQLLNILGIELFKIREASEESENFKKVLVKFLGKEAFSRWLDVVFELPTMDFNDSSQVDDTPEWLSRLLSFKNFLILLLRKKSFVQMPSESNKLLMDKCLETLVKSAEDLENGADSRPFVILSELGLILINDQKTKYTNTSSEDVKLLKNIESLIKTTTNCYTEMHKRAKESILAISIKTLDLESDEIEKNSAIALSFVRFNIEILCLEFFAIEHSKDSEDGKNFTVILAITLLKKLLLLNTNGEISSGCNHWFNHHKIFNRLMSVTSYICQDFKRREITTELLDLLVLFAKGSHSKELLHCDIGDYLWMKLLPPKEIQDQGCDKWTSQEWWAIYSKGIQLVKVLLEQHSHLFIKDALFFVGIHEEFLVDCLLLSKSSLEPNAVGLIKITLELMSEVFAYESFWRIDYHQSVMNLAKCIQSLLDSSVSLLHRPKILKRLTEASKMQFEEYSDAILTDPCDDLVNAMNELVETVTLCCKCLLQFSPNLLNLICDPEFHQNKWIPFIEVQFGAPKINADSFQMLSFGTVLSSIALFVKVLNLQHHTFKQTPLNQLPAEDGNDGHDTVSMASFSESAHSRALGASSPMSPRRPFSKSLSMNSVTSSIVQASNELLSHLDAKTCISALEFMLTLLASQSLLAMKNKAHSTRDKQLIRRELSNELYCFHDFVKKKILKDTSKSVFCRSKQGAVPIVNNIDDDEEMQQGSSRSAYQRRSQDLRVNVVRKLHLQQKTSPFEIPSDLSPIQQRDYHAMDVSSQRSTAPTTSSTVKRVGFDLTSTAQKVSVQEDDEPYVVNRGDPSFTGLSSVKLVEEDYLHVLSNLFMFICQNEN